MRTVELHSRQGISKIITGETMQNSMAYINNNKLIILADEKVIKFHSHKFPECPVIPVPSGEKSKSIFSVIDLYR